MPRSTLTLNNFVKAFGLIRLTSAAVLPGSDQPTLSLGRRDNVWPWAVIGDSWGSGVSYNDDVLYDGNKDSCLRTKESHGPQMEASTSWLGDFTSELRDAACSGSQLVDLAKGGYQMGKVGRPNMVVMTSGGNNAGFGHIVDVCIYHSDFRHNYGPAYKDDDPNNPTGECGQALNGAADYINGAMRQDLINTINDILADPNVHDNADFLLYLTGYAQFFGTDYDDWCNTERWNIWGVSPVPYLSKELRTAFNDRVSAVNNLYKDVVSSQFSKQVRYVDIDTGFGGHRFCEPGASHQDQVNVDTNFEGVYLWNLNWPWQVTNEPAPAGVDSDNIRADEAQQIFGDGGGVTAWTGGSGTGNGGNTPSNGWRLRPFHPRYSGYKSITESIIKQLKADGLPKAANEDGGSPPPPPAYAPGTCSFHLDERETCASDDKNLYAIITMYDNNKAVIGQTNTDGKNKALGDPINDGAPLSFQSKLPHPLVVVGEHRGDYVQFNYNGLQFQSRDEAHCSEGGWDPRGGAVCGLRFGNRNSVSTFLSPCCIFCKRRRKEKSSCDFSLTLCETAQTDGLFVPVLRQLHYYLVHSPAKGYALFPAFFEGFGKQHTSKISKFAHLNI